MLLSRHDHSDPTGGAKTACFTNETTDESDEDALICVLPGGSRIVGPHSGAIGVSAAGVVAVVFGMPFTSKFLKSPFVTRYACNAIKTAFLTPAIEIGLVAFPTASGSGNFPTNTGVRTNSARSRLPKGGDDNASIAGSLRPTAAVCDIGSTDAQ